MKVLRRADLACVLVAAGVAGSLVACQHRSQPAPAVDEVAVTPRAEGRRLQHAETLRWIADHRAWRVARKTRPIWARAVKPDEVGKEFVTADHAVERAQADHWLCVGAAGEPWFQTREKIASKYQPAGSETRRFSFDDAPHTYQKFVPLPGSRNWAARIAGPGIEGFYIKPNYPTDGPLYSPAGGWVITDYVDDPYAADPNDVWLVQEPLFDSTYEVTQ